MAVATPCNNFQSFATLTGLRIIKLSNQSVITQLEHWQQTDCGDAVILLIALLVTIYANAL